MEQQLLTNLYRKPQVYMLPNGSGSSSYVVRTFFIFHLVMIMIMTVVDYA